MVSGILSQAWGFADVNSLHELTCTDFEWLLHTVSANERRHYAAPRTNVVLSWTKLHFRDTCVSRDIVNIHLPETLFLDPDSTMSTCSTSPSLRSTTYHGIEAIIGLV